jgi:large conductance mechanosensitive channel
MNTEGEGKSVGKKVGGFFSEFWTFAAKGNAIQLAVAVVVGGAFSAVVNSLVNDIITPFISLGTGNVEFSQWGYVIRPSGAINGTTTPPLVVGYGHLIQVTINFLIVALSIFLIYKLVANTVQRLQHREEEEQKAEPPAQEKLLTEIRDLLKEEVQNKKKNKEL